MQTQMTDTREKRPVGRPSSFSQKTADEICERMADGETLREICRDEEIPDRSTVMRWLAANEQFRDQYARARELLLEHWADETVEIADDGTNDWVLRQKKDGSTDYEFDGEHVQRSRLRVDTRKWMLSKLAPKKYGDNAKVEVSGPDGGPIQTVTDQVILEAARRLLFMLRQAEENGKTIEGTAREVK
jgi:hypothetical protein